MGENDRCRSSYRHKQRAKESVVRSSFLLPFEHSLRRCFPTHATGLHSAFSSISIQHLSFSSQASPASRRVCILPCKATWAT